jgi:hypothetical protein
LAEVSVEFLASAIEGTLLVLLGFHGIDQRSTFVIDSASQNLFDVFPSQRRVFVQIPNDLSAQRPQVVHVFLDGLWG